MHALFRTTKDVDFQPNTVAYTSCLNACAFTQAVEERETALNFLHQVMVELENSKYCEPNNRSYATYLKGLLNLMPFGSERDEFASNVFDNCCKRGQVDYSVLENLRNASLNVYKERLGRVSTVRTSKLHLTDLPADWSSNVKNPFRRQRFPSGYSSGAQGVGLEEGLEASSEQAEGNKS